MTLPGLPAFGANRPPLPAHALAARIVASPRFHLHAHAAQEDWWSRALAWVASHVESFFARGVNTGGPLLNVLGDALLIAAAGLVVFACVRLLTNVTREASADAHGSVHALPSRLASRDWYNRALLAASQGRYGAGVVLLFRAALAILDLRGAVNDDPSRTVEESKAQLRQRAPSFLPGFDAIARSFTDALYAEKTVDETQWNAARAAFEALFAAVTSGSRA